MKRIVQTAAAVICATTADAGPMIPDGHCALILASRPSLAEAQDFARSYGTGAGARIYLSNNGWYAISDGIVETDRAGTILDIRKQAGTVPDDAYCSSGTRFQRAYGIPGGSRSTSTEPAPQAATYVNSPEDGYLNMRDGPSASYGIVRALTHGTQVEIIEDDGRWRKIRLNGGATGWVNSRYLTEETPSDEQRRYVTSPSDGFLNLRRGPGSSHEIIRRMDHGSSVWIMERQGSWARLRHEDSGATGWAYIPNLQRNDPLSVKGEIGTALADLAEEAAAASSGSQQAPETGSKTPSSGDLRAAYLAFSDAWNLSYWRTENERWIIGVSLQSYDPQGMDWCHTQISVTRLGYKDGEHGATISDIYHVFTEDLYSNTVELLYDSAARESVLSLGRISLPGDGEDGVVTQSCETRYHGSFRGPQSFECGTPYFASSDTARLQRMLDAFKDYALACVQARTSQ